MRLYRSVHRGRAPWIICRLMLVAMLLPALAHAAAGDLTLFGPKRYERQQGKPWAFSDSFNGCANSGGQALLRVENGANRDSSLSSALIVLNGTSVLVEADFKNQAAVLERAVTINPGSNTLSTQLKSGGQKETPFLVVTVVGLGCDSTPPVISAPQPVDGTLLGDSRPVIAASYADNSGGAGIDPSSVRVTLDGGDITPSCTVGGTSVSCTPASPLPEGGHDVTLAVADLLQNSASLGWRFTTDTVAPNVAITAPANGQFLASRSVSASGSIDDPTATVTVNGKAATVSGALFSVADVPLAEGANLLTVVAVDPAGNRSESGITVNLDTSLPQITVTSPASGSFTNAGQIIVSGTVSEPVTSLTVNGQPATVDGLSFTSSLTLAEGLNSLNIEVLDRAGNRGTTIVTVNLDTVKPQIFVVAPVEGALTKNPALTVSGSVSEPVTSLTVNGQPATVNGLSFTSALILMEGSNTITVVTIDRAGNGGSAAVTMTLDSTPPLAPALEPLATPTNAPQVKVSGSAEPWSNVSLYNGSERVATIVTPQDGRFSLPDMVLHEGENSFTVTALDPAGNESAPSPPVVVVLDTVKPVVGISAPLDKAIINTPIITLTGSIDDPAAAVTVNGLAALNSGGTWSLENFTLQEGESSLLVEAKDPAGNKGSATVAVTLDTILPTVTIAEPADGLYTNIRTLTISGAVSESLAALTVNGQPATVNGLSFTSTLTLAEGVNGITVEATDLAGNKGQGTVTVTLDTLAPQLSVIGPEDGALLNNGQITFGANPAEPVVSVIVNGVAVPAGTSGYTLPITLSEGTNNLTVTAIDKAGNSTTATYTVTLDSTPPVITVTAPQAGTIINSAEVTITGTVSEPVTSVTVNGQPATVNGLSFTSTLSLTEGQNSILVVAADAAGNQGMASVPVTLDTVKPVITVTAPQSGAIINTPDVAITGSVNEPLTSLTVNGQQLTVNDLTFTTTMALAPGQNSALIVATDPAGNSATTTLIIQRDSTPPVVTIAAPPTGLLTKNSAVQVSGSVDDADVLLTVNGQPVTANGATFSFTYTLSDGENAITVEAIDPASNRGTAAVSVTLDATPPLLTIGAPVEATAGANIAISLGASDNRQLTLVEFRADGVPIWSAGSGPAIAETIAYRLSPLLNVGAVVTLQARGTDAAGNEGTATATIQITQAAMGPGYVQGKVLEDSRGLKLEGAEVQITPQLQHPTNSTNSLNSAADGGYFLEMPAGSTLVKVAKPGYTTVERLVTVIPEKNSPVLDARLTKISDTKNLIDAAGGTAKVALAFPSALSPQPSAPSVELTVPAAVLTAQADLRLTPVSNQGLAGVLPLGWSPLAAIDIRALDPATGATLETTLAASATLKLPLPVGVSIDPAAPPVLARYDSSAHQWLAIGSVQLDGLEPSAPSPNPSALSPINSIGQYALLLADPAPAAPPAPVMGQAFQPSARIPQPDFTLINTTGKVVPQASPPSTGLKAAGEVVLTTKEGATPTFISGLVLTGRITEKFDLKSGDAVETPVYSQDLVLYRYPCTTNIGAGAVTPLAAPALSGAEVGELRTTFPVSPSKDYTIVDLLLGKVGIEIIRPDTSASGVMVGPDGGRLVDEGGNIIAIPQGALALTTPVATKTAAAVTGAVGSDFTLIRAVEVNLTRQTLAQPATISIPAPAGIDTSLPLVVAKQIDVRGVAKLKLVALATQSGSLISSAPLTLELANSTNSINSGGVYYFLQAKGQLGFVTGTVSDSGGAPFTGALVKTDKGSLVDLSASTGKYLLAGPVAAFTATATDLYKGDEVSANSALTAANQSVTVDLRIMMIPPQVTAIAPANGAVNVQPDVPVVVTFSKAMDTSTVNSTTLKLINSSNSEPVTGSITWNIDSKTVTFYPTDPFKQESGYSVTVGGSVRDLQGYPLWQDMVSSFTIRKTTPPAMPPAGAISATFPDAEGFITVTATQGSADPADTVLLINDTTGEITSVNPATNGSFTGRVRGQLGDEIKVVLMDYSGNQTVISWLTFKSPDGSYLVTARGGKVEGEGGSILDIPEGALLGPAVIRVTALPEAGLPSPLQAPGHYLAAFNIDSGGIPFQKEVKLSIPIPEGFDPATPVYVVSPSTLYNDDGTTEQVYEIIDSTKVVDGRITTASPPFDGIVSFGSYSYVAFPTVTVGTVSGHTYQEMNDQPGYQPTLAGTTETPTKDAAGNLVYQYDKPVARAVIRTPAAWNYVSYSRANGFYAGITTLSGSPGASDIGYTVTATHPLTMQKVTWSGTVNERNQFIKDLNFKLAEKGTIPPDKSSPTVEMDIQIAPGQPADVKFVAGTLPVNARVQVPVTVFDQWMSTPPTLTVQYRGLADTVYTTVVLPAIATTSVTDYKEMADTGIKIKRYEYWPVFNSDPLLNSLQLSSPGLYLFTVKATDATGNPPTTRSIQVRVVEPGEVPEGKPGAPVVDEILPKPGETNIMINAPITVSFSEPVDSSSLTIDSFKLVDTSTGFSVPATITTFITDGRMKAALSPNGNLAFDRTYEIILTKNIKDADEANPLDSEYRAHFTTKVPKLYDLTADQFSGSRDIELHNDPNTCSTYAYVTAGDNGYRVINVTNPKTPTVRTDLATIQKGINYRCVGIGSDGTLGMTENIVFASGNQYGYIRFYDLLANPISIRDVKQGQERIAEAMSGIPGRVAVNGNYAYIATAGTALQVVDLSAAREYASTGQISDGSTIVGLFDSIGQGYGSPNDIVVYKPGKAFLTTNPGWLISLDLSEPSYPFLMNASRPNGLSVLRIAVATDYSYIGGYGVTGSMDLAVASGMEGKISTINVTDPYSPSYIKAVTDHKGAEILRNVRDIAINKNSGLAFVTTIDAVLVIDIKDPYNPKLLNEIKTVPGTTAPMGTSSALKQRDGWVYLASEQNGIQTMDFYTPPLNGKEAVVTVDSVNNLFLDKDGYTLNQLKVKYTINPPGYEAQSARVMFMEKGLDAWVESVSGPTTGTGTAVFPKGMKLDKNKEYEVYVVINCNTPDAKVSERKMINVNILAIQDKKNPCNKTPGKNAKNGINTLLLAANSDGRATIQLLNGPQKDIVWKIESQGGSFINQEIVLDNFGTSEVPELRLMLAFDTNCNGSFDSSDEFMIEFKIILVTKLSYTGSTIDLNAGWAAAGLHFTDLLSLPAGKEPLRLSSALLATYMGAKNWAVIKPSQNLTKPLESIDPRLTHISGAEFVPLDSNFDKCSANLTEYVYSDLEVSEIIVNSKTITNWYTGELSKKFGEGKLIEGLIQLKEEIKTPNSKGEGGDFRDSDYLSDTHLAIGGHTRTLLEGVAYVVKDPDIDKLCVETINVSGEIEDLYDWDYFSGGVVGIFAQKAASIQAGWNAGLNDDNSEKGKLFFTKFKFNNTKELFEYRYDILGNEYKQYSLCY